MSRRGLASAVAPGSCVAAADDAGAGPASGAGPGAGAASGEPARASPGAAASSSAAAACRQAARTPATAPCVFLTIASLSPRVRLLPVPHLAAGLVEEALVVALAHPLAGLRSQPREQRCIHVVDLQVLGLLGGRDFVGAE